MVILTAAPLITGCGPGQPEQPPTYNRFRNQLVETLFTALAEQDPEMALVQLDRLREISREPALVNRLVHEERQRLLIQQVNLYLAQGRFRPAKAYAAQHLGQHGPDSLTEHILDLINELLLLKQFQQEPPPASSQVMSEKLDELWSKLELIGENQMAEAWQVRQMQIISQLREQDINRIIQDLEQALENQAPDRPQALLEQLADLQPQHPILQVLLTLADPALPFPPESLKPATTQDSENLEKSRLLELSLLAGWSTLVERDWEFKSTVLQQLRDRAVASPRVGLILRARLAAELGNSRVMLRYGRQLKNGGNYINSALIDLQIKHEFVPDERKIKLPYRTRQSDYQEMIRQQIMPFVGHHGTKVSE